MADRIEREIEEILRKIDDFVPDRARRPARSAGRPFAAAQSWLARSLARVSLRQVAMWALVVVLLAFFLRGLPGGSWLMIGGLIVFITAAILSRRGGNAPKLEKRWRGEPIDLSGPPWPDRLKAWIKGRRRG